MIGKLRRHVSRAILCGVGLLVLARVGNAQEGPATPPVGQPSAQPSTTTLGSPQAPPDADLRARIERLEKQNQELMHALQNVSTQGDSGGKEGAAPLGRDQVQKIVGDYLKQKDSAKKAEEEAKKARAEEEGYKIGTDLKVSASFNEIGNLWLRTPNNDFTMHPGFWMHYDNVFWNQSGGLRTIPDGRPGKAQGVASGAALGGIGNLEDGTYFRRLRPFVEGTMWDIFEYRLILALENNQFSSAGLDEFWVAWNRIPAIGTVRVGHVKDAVGFEGDMTASSRSMTFMERSSYAEAIELNQNFVTGIWLHNDFLHEHMTYTATAFRSDLATSSGAFFGDGQWGAQGRLTFLPIYECEGRHWLHLGVSGGWRNGTNNIAVSPFRTIQLRARPELREDDPAGSPGGAQIVPNANSNRMIDTAAIAIGNDYLAGLEFCYVRGPFSLQAEYGWNWVDGAVGIAPAGVTLNPKLTPPQDYLFNGGYVQVAYTLTGEARAYDKKGGTLARQYFGPKGLFSNAWFVRDENGHLNAGTGAWEVAARYSYTDLNSGGGLNRIQGGIMDGFSAAVNWHLNPNLVCMFDWVYDHRYALPPGSIPGFTSGLGMRVQLSF